MAISVTALVGRPDPYTVVVKDNVRLPAYTTGGVNVSIGELASVDYAQVLFSKASGAAAQISGRPFEIWVSSGSGNIVTIAGVTQVSFGTLTVGLEIPNATALSGWPVAVLAYGH